MKKTLMIIVESRCMERYRLFLSVCSYCFDDQPGVPWTQF